MNRIMKKVKPSLAASGKQQHGVEVSLLTVTPDLAADLLQLNTQNRKINAARVYQYRQMMHRGEWDDGVADICVDSRGNLVNGQHCLEAVVRSGCTIVVTLKTGLRPRSQDVMDTQRSRTLGDQLQIEGFSNAKTVATLSKIVLLWRREGQLPSLTKAGNAGPNSVDRRELLSFCRQHREELEAAASLGESRRRFSGSLLTGSAIATMHVIFGDCAPEHAEAWLDELFGVKESNSQPVTAYRNKLVQLRGTHKEWSPSLKFLFAVKSFNAYVARKELKLFRLQPGEQVSIDIPEGVS